MAWLLTPIDIDIAPSMETGRLTYTEAQLFLRAGDDVRRSSWESGVFLRDSVRIPSISGYTVKKYKPTINDLNAYDWRKA